MADPFIAEIRIFPFYFGGNGGAPKGWAQCNGQLIPITQNTALFAILGTFYGGDGKSTFALPDLQGSAAMHQGQGPGLSLRDLGNIGGAEAVTLLVSEMPVHTHGMRGVEDDASFLTPQNMLVAAGNQMFAAAPTGGAVMAPQALAPAGGSLPHNNMQPYLTMNFCIALQGVFPPPPTP